MPREPIIPPARTDAVDASGDRPARGGVESGRRLLTLTRAWDSRVVVDDIAHEVTESEPVDGFPCPPPEALAALRHRVHDVRTSVSEPIRWWHADGVAWAAVTDLHRSDRHYSAVALAMLLRWCENNYSHHHVRVWTLTETGSAS